MAVVITKNRIAQVEYLAKYSMLFQAREGIQGPIQTITRGIVRRVIAVEARGLESIQEG